MKNKAMTLLEILIAVLIIAITVGGLVAVFVSSRGFIEHSRSRLQAAQLSKYYIDQLHGFVRQDSWNTASNQLYDGAAPSYSTTFSGVTYNVTSVVDAVDPVNPGGLRRVVTKIKWTEPK
ncbi:MAG: hypothetical protein MUF05_01510 [Candidatus Omnitrophica bacterium]|jgi:Tfp pilus assembly protein PilV|nr:hypothetical protein [Candidatus Omnitrophota bacterium]